MLISYTEAADMLGVPANDSLLVRLVAAADAWAQRTCDRVFERGVFTETLRSYGRDFVIVRESPIIAVTSVIVDSTGSFSSNSSTTIDPSQIAFNSDVFEDDPRLFMVSTTLAVPANLTGLFPCGERTVRVTYEAGWWPAQPSDAFQETSLNLTLAAADTPAAPEDIRAALLDLVCSNYKRGSDERMQTERQGDRSWSRFADGIDPQIVAAVNRYRRFRI